MKNILLAISLTFLFACCSNNTQDKKDLISTKDYLLQDNSVSKLVTANHKKLSGVKGDFESYKLFLDKLNNDSLTSIPFALDYIKTCISADNPDRDSIFLLFYYKFYEVVNRLNDSLETKYKTIFEQLDKDSNTVELNAFKNNLKACGIGIFITEGIYYLDVISDFFYNNFKNRVSDGVAEFLNIRKEELKQGFSEDARMLISFEDLYLRVKRWENFINKYPNTVITCEAYFYYTTYLETLLTGMDGSWVFDYPNYTLRPEVKTLYEKIMGEGAKSPTTTTEIISSYYAFLARHDFKYNDSIKTFLKTYNLSPMTGVQPHTR